MYQDSYEPKFTLCNIYQIKYMLILAYIDNALSTSWNVIFVRLFDTFIGITKLSSGIALFVIISLGSLQHVYYLI